MVVLKSIASRTDSIYATKITEALACHLRFKLALFLHLSHVVMESDCLSLIQKLQATTQDQRELGLIICDIKELYQNLHYNARAFPPSPF